MNTRYAILFCVLSLTACKTLELKSHWRDRQVIIDGTTTAWQDVMTTLSDHGIRIGLLNDSKDLYLCLATTDTGFQRQVMRQGLTLWFDRKAREEKTFGIRFPLPRIPQFGGPGRESPPEPRDTLAGRFPPPGDELEIFGPEERKHQRMSMIESGGIEIRVAVSRDTLIYEAKVPLVDYGPQPFAIGAQAGSTISICLETMAKEMMDQEQTRSSGPGRRGGGYGGGRRSRGGSEGRRPGAEVNPEPFSAWAKVFLASEVLPDTAGTPEENKK